MGYKELFLVLVSIILLSLLTTQINTNIAQGREALQEVEIEHTAISIAQQFIEEARSKKFDAQVGMIDPADMPDGFTPYNSLGHGSWESYPNFNDVDDYHNFNQTVMVKDIDFSVSIQVSYVQDANPEQEASTETFFKKMTVTVSSSWLPNSVTLKHVFSYFGVGG